MCLFSVTTTISHEKIHHLEELLFKSKDEVIDLQKRLVDVRNFILILIRFLFYLTIASTTSYCFE
jgi:hypothetical protein